MESNASRPRRPTPVQKDFRARWFGPKRVPGLNIHTTPTDTSSLHFITPVTPLDIVTMLTQLEQYANYEHSTNNLTRLVQLQR